MLQTFFTVDVLFSGTTLSVLFSSDFSGNCLTADPHMHKHVKYEMQYVEEGNCVLKMKDKRITCAEGHIFIVPPFEEHLLEYTPGTKTRTLLFAPTKAPAKDTLLDAICAQAPLPIKDNFGALERLLRIRKLIEERSIISEEKVRGEVTVFFAELAEAILPPGRKHKIFKKENRGEEIEAYLAQNCYSPNCTCDALAKRLNLSKRHTHRICIEHYGVPFRTLLHRTRMEIARFRLENTSISVTELAELLGYASVASFSAAYKRHFGKAPTDKT